MNIKQLWGVLFVLGAIMACTAQSDTEPTYILPETTPTFDIRTNIVEAQDQAIENNTITVDRVVIVDTGWVVVKSEVEGRPGVFLGWSPVRGGETADIIIPISTDGITPAVYVQLFRDLGRIDTFEPEFDRPIAEYFSGDIVQERILILDE